MELFRTLQAREGDGEMVQSLACCCSNSFQPCLLQSLMEKRVGPWINKKIVEYIGEEEPTLRDFICNKVGSSEDLE